MKRNILWLTAALAPIMAGAPREVTFSSPAGSVEVYDFAEVTVNITGPDARNPFTEATLRVIEDLISRDNRFKTRSIEISDAVIGAKRMSLGDEPAEKIAEFIAMKIA